MAAKFASDALYPGGTVSAPANGLGIVFSDPYPDDSQRPNNIWRVNLPLSTFLPWVWNRKAWNSTYEMTLTVDSGTPFTISVAGKITSSEIYWNSQDNFNPGNLSLLISSLSSTNKEPGQRVGGACDVRTFNYHGDGDPNTTDETTHPTLGGEIIPGNLEFIYNSVYVPGPGGGFPETLDLTVNDADAVESGNLLFTGTSYNTAEPLNFLSMGNRVVQAWIKNDGTVDVFCLVYAQRGPSVIYQHGELELVSQPIVPETDVISAVSGPATFTLFGVECVGHWRFNGLDTAAPAAVTDFSFSVALGVSEEWEY